VLQIIDFHTVRASVSDPPPSTGLNTPAIKDDGRLPDVLRPSRRRCDLQILRRVGKAARGYV